MWLTTLEKMRIPDARQHQLLWTYFPEIQKQEGAQRPFCFRDTGDQILMLSTVKPTTESREITFTPGQTLMFESRASIGTRRYKGVVYKPEHFTAEHVKGWFKNRFKDAADINYVTFERKVPHIMVAEHKNFKKIVLDQTMFYGTLTVIDAEKFDEIVGRGFGQGPCYGFGALILPQVMK